MGERLRVTHALKGVLAGIDGAGRVGEEHQFHVDLLGTGRCSAAETKKRAGEEGCQCPHETPHN
jgi:hypothetical protein